MQNKIKIAVLGWGGSIHTRKWVAALSKRGYEIMLVGMTGEPLDGIKSVLYRRGGKSSYIWKAAKAVSEVRKFGPDMLHVHYAAGFGLWGILCRVRPMIVSVWGADVIDFPSNIITKSLIRSVLSRATRITATSQMLLKVTDELLPGAAKKTSVIPFGVTIPDSHEPEPEGDEIRLCFVKALALKYGPDICLKALAMAIEQHPGLHLSMAGSGVMEKELLELVTRLKISKHVTFCGHIEHEKIYDFICSHHIMVMPSTMKSESFGVAVLEAGACSRPTIASDIGGVPEVLRHNETGVLVEPRSPEALSAAIVDLAKDTERRRTMGKKAYEFVRENYDWNSSVDLMANLYERVIDEA